jgi:hypothetical protein
MKQIIGVLSVVLTAVLMGLWLCGQEGGPVTDTSSRDNSGSCG